MAYQQNRRLFLRDLGLSAAALPFIGNLTSLAHAADGVVPTGRKQRLVFMLSPNGVVPWNFWPETTGTDFVLPPILKPLEPLRDRLLILKGVANKIRGDGDGHMRGMSCLLTAIELFPGNVQGGSDTPAGWAKGISIDQEIKNFLQSREESHTRFGSLEFGVCVPDRADPWTRWVYGGPNQPIAPVSNPYQMFAKLYGGMQDQETLTSVLDDVVDDLNRIRGSVGGEDLALLDQHADFVRQMERELIASKEQEAARDVPELEQGLRDGNTDNMPKFTDMQIEMMVNAFANDMARVATLQYTNSVGNARMRWLGVDEGHHTLSHEPDSNDKAQEDLTKINTWYAEKLAHLAQRLAETPEPGGEGSLLDNTTIIWTNELGKGNSHTRNDIPFICVGNGLGVPTGRSLDFKNEHPHNRLHLAIAHNMGHRIPVFGKPEFCEAGPFDLG